MKPLIRSVAIAFALGATVTAAHAQNYPVRPIEWVVPYPAGGGTDIVARALGDKMSKSLGQTIVIANKPGAATAIGAAYAARAKPDGYTIVTGDTATLAANPALYPSLAYDPAKDFSAIGLMARFAMILAVNPDAVQAKTLDEFIAWAKQQKDGVDYATPGPGSPHHLATELFKQRTGLNLVHIPYKGAAPAVQDVVGGQVPFMIVDSAAGKQFIEAGRLRPIAVASTQRLESLPEVPTFIELGLEGFEAYAWQGLLAPKGTPQPVIDKLSTALREALDSDDIKKQFDTMGLEVTPSTAAEMDKYAAEERERWGALIKEAGITVQ